MKHLPAILIVFAVLAITACHNKPPMGILSYGEMKDLLYDYHLSLQLARQSSDSTTQYSHLYTETVLRKHGVTRAEFDTSMLWYSRHTDLLYKLYGELQKEIEEESRLLGNSTSRTARYAHLSQSGDTANIWQGSDAYLLTTSPLERTMTFTLQADSTFLPGDRFLWHFTNLFVYPSGRREAMVNLSVHYDNDSVSSSTSRMSADGEFEVVVTATDRPVKEITGYIHHFAERGDKERILCITYPSLIRFHKERPAEEKADTLQADSLKADTLPTDSIAADTARPDTARPDTALKLFKHKRHTSSRNDNMRPTGDYKRY